MESPRLKARSADLVLSSRRSCSLVASLTLASRSSRIHTARCLASLHSALNLNLIQRVASALRSLASCAGSP
eukprot:949833-Rhodomonas_salina.1